MKNIKRLLSRYSVPALTGLALLGLAAPRTFAWNGTGHMVVADIAYDNLTPQTKAAVDALLQHQRDYGLWMSEMPAGYTDKGRFAFMKASTWPDDIRKTPDDRPIWHYIDLPVISPGYTPDPAALLVVTPNAETQITAENGSADDEKRDRPRTGCRAVLGGASDWGCSPASARFVAVFCPVPARRQRRQR